MTRPSGRVPLSQALRGGTVGRLGEKRDTGRDSTGTANQNGPVSKGLGVPPSGTPAETAAGQRCPTQFTEDRPGGTPQVGRQLPPVCEGASDGSAARQHERRPPQDPGGAARQALCRQRKGKVVFPVGMWCEKLARSARARCYVGNRPTLSELKACADMVFDELLETDPRLSRCDMAEAGEAVQLTSDDLLTNLSPRWRSTRRTA
jgi:hypothetical protein